MSDIKCYKCGSPMHESKTEVTTAWGEYEITLKGVNALKCENCGEVIYHAEDVQMMQSLSKSLANHKPHIEYLNVTETANILRVSKQSVYNMIKDGRIQAYKVGREWRFMPSDIYAVGQSSNTQHQIQMAAKGGEIDQADLKVILDELERDSQK